MRKRLHSFSCKKNYDWYKLNIFWLIKGLWRTSYINKHFISNWKQSIQHINWTLPWDSIFFLYTLLHWGPFFSYIGACSTVTLGPFFSCYIGAFFLLLHGGLLSNFTLRPFIDCYIGNFFLLLHWSLSSTATLGDFMDCYIWGLFRLLHFGPSFYFLHWGLFLLLHCDLFATVTLGPFCLLLYWDLLFTVKLGPFSSVTSGGFFFLLLHWDSFYCYIWVFFRLLNLGLFFRLDAFTILYKHLSLIKIVFHMHNTAIESNCMLKFLLKCFFLPLTD